MSSCNICGKKILKNTVNIKVNRGVTAPTLETKVAGPSDKATKYESRPPIPKQTFNKTIK